MAKLVNFQIVNIEKFFVIGKSILVSSAQIKENNPIPAFWDKCFEEKVFIGLETLKDKQLHGDYVGFMTNWDDTKMTYVVGMCFSDNSEIPDSYDCFTVQPCTAAISYVQGKNVAEVAGPAHELTFKEILGKGYDPDFKQGWSMELYNCPRYTTPDEDGNIIMDYYLPCKTVSL